MGWDVVCWLGLLVGWLCCAEAQTIDTNMNGVGVSSFFDSDLSENSVQGTITVAPVSYGAGTSTFDFYLIFVDTTSSASLSDNASQLGALTASTLTFTIADSLSLTTSSGGQYTHFKTFSYSSNSNKMSQISVLEIVDRVQDSPPPACTKLTFEDTDYSANVVTGTVTCAIAKSAILQDGALTICLTSSPQQAWEDVTGACTGTITTTENSCSPGLVDLTNTCTMSFSFSSAAVGTNGFLVAFYRTAPATTDSLVSSSAGKQGNQTNTPTVDASLQLSDLVADYKYLDPIVTNTTANRELYGSAYGPLVSAVPGSVVIEWKTYFPGTSDAAFLEALTLSTWVYIGKRGLSSLSVLSEYPIQSCALTRTLTPTYQTFTGSFTFTQLVEECGLESQSSLALSGEIVQLVYIVHASQIELTVKVDLDVEFQDHTSASVVSFNMANFMMAGTLSQDISSESELVLYTTGFFAEPGPTSYSTGDPLALEHRLVDNESYFTLTLVRLWFAVVGDSNNVLLDVDLSGDAWANADIPAVSGRYRVETTVPAVFSCNPCTLHAESLLSPVTTKSRKSGLDGVPQQNSRISSFVTLKIDPHPRVGVSVGHLQKQASDPEDEGLLASLWVSSATTAAFSWNHFSAVVAVVVCVLCLHW